MLELLKDGWDLLATVLVAVWDILGSVISLVVIDDPFWQGVEFTIVTLLAWKHRALIIDTVDRVPLLGGLLARGLKLADSFSNYLLEGTSSVLGFVKANTWDRLASLVKKADKDLRD